MECIFGQNLVQGGVAGVRALRHCRVPVKKVELFIGGKWGELRRTYNNMYAANGGPYNTWPLPIRITSMLNDTVYDQ